MPRTAVPPWEQQRRDAAAAAAQSTSRTLAAVGVLLVAAVLLLVYHGHEAVISGLFGLVSALAFLGWLLTAWIAHGISQLDEDQLYEGGDRAGIVIFLPLGLSASWLLLFVVTLASRFVLREDVSVIVISQALMGDLKLFACTAALGLILVPISQCFPNVGLLVKLLPPLLLAAAAAFALSADNYCGSATDCYSVLGVEHDASPSELKKVFRRRSLACFPEEQVCSEEEFVALQLSYFVLSSGLRREAYDAYLLCRARQWELLCRLGWIKSWIK